MKVWIVVCSNYYSAGFRALQVENAKCFASIEEATDYIRVNKYYDDYTLFEEEMKI